MRGVVLVAELQYGRGTFVLIGCGAAKADTRRPAKDLYTSTYFQLKREFAEAATNWITDATERGNGWMILSAKHGVWPPNLELDPYDTTIGDLSEDELDEWARRVNSTLIDWLCSPFCADEPDNPPCKHLIVLAGSSYVEPLQKRDAFSASERHNYGVPAAPQFPFQSLDLGGIGEQMAWLKAMISEVDATPAKRTELSEFGGGYERERSRWQLDDDPIPVEGTEQAGFEAFANADRRSSSEQELLPTAVPDGGSQ